ncbi:MAG: CDP-glycerol glycerophosphotransferase family protein, partial [FCB group bacterium]|nr:CDP-glycerol glycerophosphotransferase family protein [FCB group bacterium]
MFVEQTPHRFYDNVKYLYLHLCRHPLANGKAIYLTRSETLRDELTKCGLPVVMEDSLRGKWMMLRAKVAVEDGLGLTHDLKSFYLYGARKIQLWHGTPLKRIQLQTYEDLGFVEGTLAKYFWVFAGRYPFYHVLISSSATCTNVGYAGAFRCGRILELGYPRNDLFFQNSSDTYMLGADEE